MQNDRDKSLTGIERHSLLHIDKFYLFSTHRNKLHN